MFTNELKLKLEILSASILNKFFEYKEGDSEVDKTEKPMDVGWTYGYSTKPSDFAEVFFNLEYFENNLNQVLDRAGSIYIIVLAKLLAIDGVSIKKAKLVTTKNKNYMILTHSYKGRDINLVIMMDDNIETKRKTNRKVKSAINLILSCIHPKYMESEYMFLKTMNSLADDNSVEVRVVPHYNEFSEHLAEQENMYVEDKFHLDLNNNEGKIFNISNLLDRYRLVGVTEDYIDDVLDCDIYSFENIIKDNLLSIEDGEGLSDDFRVLRCENSAKSYAMMKSIDKYVADELNAKILDVFYTENYIYKIIR